MSYVRGRTAKTSGTLRWSGPRTLRTGTLGRPTLITGWARLQTGACVTSLGVAFCGAKLRLEHLHRYAPYSRYAPFDLFAPYSRFDPCGP